MRRRRAGILLAGGAIVVAACGGSGQDDIVLDTNPPTGSSQVTSATGPIASGGDTATSVPAAADVTVTVDVAATGATISSDILGLTTDTLTPDEMHDMGATGNSWGGNPITRYNYVLGNAFNNGSDYEFRNTSYGNPAVPVAQQSMVALRAADLQARLAIPTLGWIAKDTNEATCSFPVGDGCLPQDDVGDCRNPKVEPPDPSTTSVESTPEMVGAWLRDVAAAGGAPEFVAMDNEPDLWGNTHYDVHPTCPTYEEILDTYLTYSAVVADAMPDAALLGPAMCCWYDYWNIAPGPTDGGEDDFVAWFLDGVRAHDEQTGTRSLDYLDVHFYPQTGVFNDEVDEDTAARRLRSTRALWDRGYRDESWIDDQIAFIPRMRRTIADHYPDTKLYISEWNFGAEETMNGALAIADVLGIFGREGVDGANYYRSPDAGSPGFLAFKMFANYDDAGSWFEGTSVAAPNTDDGPQARLTSYAAVDPVSGTLRVMLVNRDPDDDLRVAVEAPGFTAAPDTQRWTYGPADPTAIAADVVATGSTVVVPASSITLLVVEPA